MDQSKRNIKDRALSVKICSQTHSFCQSVFFFTGVVEELTGEPPVDFRSFVREEKRLLGC